MQLCIRDAYSERINNFSESGRGLGHMAPSIFGIRSNISLKLLDLETSNLIHGFGNAEQAHKYISLKVGVASSRDPYNFWQYGRLS